MQGRRSLIHTVSVVIAAACFAAPGAQADTTTYDTKPSTTAEPTQRVGPSASNDSFKKLRTQCETEVPSSKARGEICVDAAALLVGSDIPDEFREMNEEQRVKIALRLLERAVYSNNLARARAYDWYNRIGFLGMSAYADPYRARELMDMMEKSGYPGGVLRKISGATSILTLTATETERRAGCATAKKMLSEGKLDADSASIAKEVVGSGICLGYEPVKQ